MTANCCEKLVRKCCLVIKEYVVQSFPREKPPELRPYGAECPLGEDKSCRRGILLSCGDRKCQSFTPPVHPSAGF